jgi:TetR/AcrR family fatty acid metabolism transcriptional regulator
VLRATKQKRTIIQDKRKAILDSAIEVFAKKGFSKANIQEVANKADVASGTVYLYFRNKDDLLLQAMKSMMDSTLSEIKSKIANIETSVEKLFLFFYHHCEIFTHNPSMARFLIVELRQSEEFYKKHPTYNPYHEYQSFVQELVTNAIAEGTTMPYNPVVISYILLGAMDTILMEWLINPDRINLEQVTTEVREILHNGMKKE